MTVVSTPTKCQTRGLVSSPPDRPREHARGEPGASARVPWHACRPMRAPAGGAWASTLHAPPLCVRRWNTKRGRTRPALARVNTYDRTCAGASLASGPRLDGGEDLTAERLGELGRDGVADLAVARVDAAGEAVPVGEALDARVLADREDAVLVGVDDGAVVRLGPADDGGHDVAPREPPEAGVGPAVGARVLGHEWLARRGESVVGQVAPASVQLDRRFWDGGDALLVVLVEHERLVVVQLLARAALARGALVVAKRLHRLAGAALAAVGGGAEGRRLGLLGRAVGVVLVGAEAAGRRALERRQVREGVRESEGLGQGGRLRRRGHVEQVLLHPSRHHRDWDGRQLVGRRRVLRQRLLAARGKEDGARAVLRQPKGARDADADADLVAALHEGAHRRLDDEAVGKHEDAHHVLHDDEARLLQQAHLGEVDRLPVLRVAERVLVPVQVEARDALARRAAHDDVHVLGERQRAAVGLHVRLDECVRHLLVAHPPLGAARGAAEVLDAVVHPAHVDDLLRALRGGGRLAALLLGREAAVGHGGPLGADAQEDLDVEVEDVAVGVVVAVRLHLLL
mmetsp:Transcript_40130/g.129423  ORF Transcript_40130/g.129423 Transcript_40130/m.129423 type:complete len:572 (-) Transcript_40130:1468-3183(-)